MNRSSTFNRAIRWTMLVAAAGFMPAFVMRCDKAALNFQRALFEELGVTVAQSLVEGGLVDFSGS